jgi:hypothetical protein
MSKNRWSVIGASLFPTTHFPHSLDLPIADFYLFSRVKQELSGTALDNEKNVLEMTTEGPSELPKDEVKKAFVPSRERCEWVADQNGEFDPN